MCACLCAQTHAYVLGHSYVSLSDAYQFTLVTLAVPANTLWHTLDVVLLYHQKYMTEWIIWSIHHVYDMTVKIQHHFHFANANVFWDGCHYKRQMQIVKTHV